MTQCSSAEIKDLTVYYGGIRCNKVWVSKGQIAPQIGATGLGRRCSDHQQRRATSDRSPMASRPEAFLSGRSSLPVPARHIWAAERRESCSARSARRQERDTKDLDGLHAFPIRKNASASRRHALAVSSMLATRFDVTAHVAADELVGLAPMVIGPVIDTIAPERRTRMPFCWLAERSGAFEISHHALTSKRARSN